MKVFFNGDLISFDGVKFYEVINSKAASIEFQYKDDRGKMHWAHVWQVIEVKKAGE